MGISVEKIGSKPVEAEQKEAVSKEDKTSDESIFTKGEEKTNTAEIVIGAVVGISLGIFLSKFFKTPSKTIQKGLRSILKKPHNNGSTVSVKKVTENSKSVSSPVREYIQDVINKNSGKAPRVSLSKLDAKATQAINSEEKAFYESILKDFDELHPEKVRCYPSAGTYCSKTHINGALSEISYSDRYVFDSNGITKHLEQKENSFEYILGKKKLNCYPSSGHFVGDEALIQEYKTFLNGRTPNADNFKEFMKAKDIDYIKSNGILGLEDKAKQISLEKGEIIKAQEELRHKDLQNMYKGLWRPYPSKQFYRVVGREELIKMLNGEKIMSPRYAQYGKECTDISTNPYYHEIMLTGKYRISFKRVNYDGSGNASFARAVSEWAPENSHWHLHRPYDISDVKLDEIKAWNGDDWIPVKIITEE